MKWFLLMVSGASLVSAAEVTITTPTYLGQRGVSLNAQVHVGGLPGRYWVVYGKRGEMNLRTDAQPLPPIRSAHLEESWDRDLAGWSGGLSGRDLIHASGINESGYVRYLGPTETENRAFPGEPPGLDVNHIDGIGGLHLCHYIYSAKLGANPLHAARSTGLNLGGGRPDFRDAEIRLRVRGNGVDPKGAELTFWAQSDHDPALQLTPHWVRANWAYTGRYATRALLNGQWSEVSYVLENDTRRWTYGGNNLAQVRAERYAYLNLDQALGNLNANFFHLYVYVDGQRPPTGTIDFDSVQIRYRNHSLLFPAHGTRLIASPRDSEGQAGRLTDGWRHGSDREWHSGPAPIEPQAFVWQFPGPVRLTTLQVHQAIQHPARDVVAYVSSDGTRWQLLSELSLPRESPVSANHAYEIQNVAAENVTHFKLEIRSGYESERWGLGEVELFGSGIPLASDREGAGLNVDLAQLSPGEEYDYQFVVETPAGECRSSVGQWTVPKEDRPIPVALWRQPAAGGTARELWARIAPLGHRTHARLETFRQGVWHRVSRDHYVGNQLTERDVKFELEDDLSEEGTQVRLVLSDEAQREIKGNPQEIRSLPILNL
jgi:hypothetical protein